jgi:hypothetical protein
MNVAATAKPNYQLGTADCLIQVLQILKEHNQPAPEIDPRWYELAREHNWKAIVDLVIAGTDPADGSQDFDVVLSRKDFENQRWYATPLGFGVRVGNRIITRLPQRGYMEFPLNVEIANPYWFRFRAT